jgi:3-hexulose-6-phosphate synthase/6-phospho-3-hexuloisomerase
MDTILQIALDLLNGNRAIKIAKEAVKAGPIWIEAGTPLIKSEGMDIIRQLRENFPDSEIIADLKTMDTGSIETEMAAKAGASIVCILGVSNDETIKEAIVSAKKYGVKIMVDLIGLEKPIQRAQKIEQYGIDFLCVHVGIDQQMKGITPLQMVKDLVQQTSIPIAVAGGINSENVADMIHAGASIIIIGGALTKSEDVTKATQIMIKAIQEKKSVATTLFKKYDSSSLQKAFSLVSTSNISDAMHRKGAMKDIHPIRKGYHMIGQALTVHTIDGDWAKPVEAIDKAKNGTVLVINASSGHTAIWGELATWSAKLRDLAGVVIDGAVRDIDDLFEIDFPIFSKFKVPNAGEPKGFGEIGSEIICGGQLVQTGDWIVGDDSGVVVIPKHRAQEIANRALDVKEHENRIREEIKSGGSLSSVLKLKKWEKKIG